MIGTAFIVASGTLAPGPELVVGGVSPAQPDGLRRPLRGIAQRLALGLGIQLRTDENDCRGQHIHISSAMTAPSAP